MTEVDNILTDAERTKLTSMARYWREVEEREDISPLEHEMNQVFHMVGINLLFVLARYIEITKGVNE